MIFLFSKSVSGMFDAQGVYIERISLVITATNDCAVLQTKDRHECRYAKKRWHHSV